MEVMFRVIAVGVVGDLWRTAKVYRMSDHPKYTFLVGFYIRAAALDRNYSTILTALACPAVL
jgi:hypothetical protein